jgi:hypothetical protein
MSMAFAAVVVLFRRSLWIKAFRNGVRWWKTNEKDFFRDLSLASWTVPGFCEISAAVRLIGECFRGK